jgi:two-component system nitrate/nitrite response regulator NarL
MMITSPIRILIADSQPVVIEGLRGILGAQPFIQIVGEATDGMEAIDKTVHLDPDIVLMDLKLPRVDGLTVIRSIHTRAPRSKILLFSSSDNKEEFVEAMKLGCAGVLLKEGPIHLIEKSLAKVQAGEIWLDSTTTAAVIRQFASPISLEGHVNALNGKPNRERMQLSQREREIIVLIAQGYKNKEIAEKMFITEQTVKNHLHNVFDKLGVSDRLELALYAIHNSLHLQQQS